jgi:hypothetical protein
MPGKGRGRSGGSVVVCVEELKLKTLCKSCIVPGMANVLYHIIKNSRGLQAQVAYVCDGDGCCCCCCCGGGGGDEGWVGGWVGGLVWLGCVCVWGGGGGRTLRHAVCECGLTPPPHPMLQDNSLPTALPFQVYRTPLDVAYSGQNFSQVGTAMRRCARTSPQRI